MYPKEVFPVKRKTKWILSSLVLLLAIGLGVGGWLYYGFQRDQIATLEDFSLSMKIVQKPSDKNEGTITVQCTLRNNTPWPQRIAYSGSVFTPFSYNEALGRPDPTLQSTLSVTDQPVLLPFESITEMYTFNSEDRYHFYAGWGEGTLLGCKAWFSCIPLKKFEENHTFSDWNECKVDLKDIPL